MVDFNKKLKGSATASKPIDPEEIYAKADRASDTGPLRRAQIAVLQEWHKKLRKQQDVIIKMHTGQGKTLIGLLILKSKLKEIGEPALYICPNTYSVQQTVAQAKRFGIKCRSADKELPEAVIEGEQILVTTVQKALLCDALDADRTSRGHRRRARSWYTQFAEAVRRFYEHFEFEPSPVDPFQMLLLLKDPRRAIRAGQGDTPL